MQKITLLIFLCYSITGSSQYIADPSFEDTLNCPPTFPLPLKSWYSPSLGSPDLYCLCNTSSNQKHPIDSNCYVGLIFYSPTFNNYREYIESELLTDLQEGKQYCVSIYILASQNCKFTTNALSIGFRSDFIFENSFELLAVDSFYNFSESVIDDTLNWNLKKIKFIATGTEKYISIGIHDSDQNIVIDSFSSVNSSPCMYYFFDKITLEECSPEPMEHFLVYPNPSSGGSVYLSNYADTVATVTLYNSLGQRVAERMLPAGANGLVAFEGLASGVYIAVYQTATGYREEKKVVVL